MKLEDLSPATLSIIASEIEDSLAGKQRKQLDSLHQRLYSLIKDLLSEVPLSVVEGSKSVSFNSNEGKAFALGQIVFAHTVVAQAASKRAEDCFIDEMHSPKYRDYLTALAKGERTGVQLAAFVGEDEATVSRKLRHLRGSGIVDWRKEGKHVLNFLTPVAQAAFNPNDAMPAEIAESIMLRKSELPSYMRQAVTFASNSEIANAGV